MRGPHVGAFCIDIDGVLCVDPAPAENDDGRRYRRFLRGARPLTLPTHEVGWLVTSRLERYRAETEDWLSRHGVRYRDLLMMDYPNQAARQQARAYDRFKADAYLATGAELFVESAPHTAEGIARLSGRPVFCFETRQLIQPHAHPRPTWTNPRHRIGAARLLRGIARLPRRILSA
ncbi:hypothetical protein [Halofilum ochraceum]|uniref:hypothetical protein n=1 Tax=Halofilum ochraceum TaxID=1611323 RepID=UPI00082C06D1|nr:hypothetical protein [Halofilum ochraceum]